ncbi:MAG: hypothetical protein ACLP5H_01650, partial [Desulfomonilaceae bacterium]
RTSKVCALILMGDWCGEETTDTNREKYRQRRRAGADGRCTQHRCTLSKETILSLQQGCFSP